jgi:hypothetical protein
MKHHLRAVLAVGVLAGLFALPARADLGQEPGSLLFFPEFDNRPGNVTFLTITNTNGDFASGAVKAHIIYVDAANCQQSNRNENLTPRDTATFVSSFHVPTLQRGYMYAYAQSATTSKAIDFDHLIGNSVRVDGTTASQYSVNPFVFQGIPGAGLATDVNLNGKLDLNGAEYDRAPNKLYVPRFFGQSPPPWLRGAYASELVLFQPLASGGVTTTVDFLIYNDNEEVYSAQDSFVCWTRKSLLAITGTFAQSFLLTTNHNPNEIATVAIESGWFQVRGALASSSQGTTANPPILGFLVDLRPYGTADLPFVEDL